MTTGASMHPRKRAFVGLNVLGGAVVLGSYAFGLLTHADAAAALWGGVPDGLRPLYRVNMLLATGGYFAFTPYLLLRTDAESSRFLGCADFRLLNALYAAILIPSALWMPLTFAFLAAPSAGLWWAIRAVLAVVGAASLGLLAALVSVRPRPAWAWHALAVAGLTAFCLQTAVLDALVWPHYFAGR